MAKSVSILLTDALNVESDADVDPEDKPHISWNKARLIWNQILELLDQRENEPLSLICRSWIYSKLSRNYSATEERQEALNMCDKALKIIHQYVNIPYTSDMNFDIYESQDFTDPIVAGILLDSMTYIGFIHASRDNDTQAKLYLTTAESYFKHVSPIFSQENPPLNLEYSLEILESSGEMDLHKLSDAKKQTCFKEFNHTFTYCLFYLAQVMKSVGENTLSMNYCMETLTRQLNWDKFEPDFMDWALNAATIAAHFMSKGESILCLEENLHRARYWLGAAECVLQRAAFSLNDNKYIRTKADIYRCWANYGIHLLSRSHENLEQLKKVKDSVTNLEPQLHDLKLDFKEYEQQIGYKLLSDKISVEEVFVKIQHWLKNASIYYSLDDHANEALAIAQESSRAYKYLAKFESNKSVECRLHKKRQDLLDAVVDKLNPQYYLLYIRQLLFELGEIANSILDLKVEIAEKECCGYPSEHQIHKINVVAERAEKYFQQFLDTFEQEKHVKLTHETVRPVLMAHFYIARINSKKLTGDLKLKIYYNSKCLMEYRYLVEYCEKVDPDAKVYVDDEYRACCDMVQLMPLKISRMHHLLTSQSNK